MFQHSMKGRGVKSGDNSIFKNHDKEEGNLALLCHDDENYFTEVLIREASSKWLMRFLNSTRTN